jgi:type IV fimbrial biogenesis protein FimT
MICHRGFTLIEIMIVISLLAFLLFLAVPNFSRWIQNTQIRTAAEAITSGLQTARAEAVRRNTSVQFVVDAPPSSSWTVSLLPPASTTIQKRPAAEGSPNVAVTITPGTTTTATFNGLGRIITNTDGSVPITAIKVDSTSLPAGTGRKLCVTLNSSGVIQMCDTQVAAGDTRACRPAAIPAGC